MSMTTKLFSTVAAATLALGMGLGVTTAGAQPVGPDEVCWTPPCETGPDWGGPDGFAPNPGDPDDGGETGGDDDPIPANATFTG